VLWSVAAIVSFLVATVFHSQPHTDAGVYNIFSVMNYGTMIFGFGALGFAPNRMPKPSIAWNMQLWPCIWWRAVITCLTLGLYISDQCLLGHER
jgi:hypothetical protein